MCSAGAEDANLMVTGISFGENAGERMERNEIADVGRLCRVPGANSRVVFGSQGRMEDRRDLESSSLLGFGPFTAFDEPRITRSNHMAPHPWATFFS